MVDVIILPTYNERENVRLLIPEIFAVVPQCRVLVVDDNSPDGTAAEVKRMQPLYPGLRLHERPGKQGLGAAYQEAFSLVLADPNVRTIITMDADGSHDPNVLPTFLEQSRSYQLVIGSRYVAGGGIASWEVWRRILSRGGNLYAGILSGLFLGDMTSGFMAINTETLKKIEFQKFGAAGYAFLMELKFKLIHEARANYLEIPITFLARRGGESKLSSQIIREGVRTPIRFLAYRLWSKN